MAYELIIVQSVSKEKNTFITRGGKDKSMFIGKNVTFTSDDISVIAKAVEVTGEFTQWELKNDYTDVPFRKGELVTLYNAEEHLWALSPAEVRSKFIRNEIFKARRSFEFISSVSKGLSESYSGGQSQNLNRGGLQFDGIYQREINSNFAYAFGIRYSREVIDAPSASLINQRFLGVVEARYYFNPIENFYNARFGIGLGAGFGQTRTETTGQASFGDALLLPMTKVSFSIPVNKKYEISFIGEFDSLRLEEDTADNTTETTNLNNSRAGFVFRAYLD